MVFVFIRKMSLATKGEVDSACEIFQHSGGLSINEVCVCGEGAHGKDLRMPSIRSLAEPAG